jgi:cytochrome c-type biogenesis protein CcmH/NrfG
MARAAVKAKQAQKAKAQPARARARSGGGRRRHAGGGNPNQQLFFSRLRRRAKIAYVLLAALFAVTFAFLGVGSGSSGLSQLFNGLNIFHHSGTSVSSALKQTQKHPNDPKAWRTLATAYENQKGHTADAVGALQQYTALKPKDAKAWTELGGLELTQAQDLYTQAQGAQAAQQLAAPGQSFQPTGKLGTALGSDPFQQSAATAANATTSNLYQQYSAAAGGAVTAYQQVTKLQPGNSSAQLVLADAARSAGQTSVAIAAYKAYLKLIPGDSTTANQVRQLIKQLSPPPAAPAKKSKK